MRVVPTATLCDPQRVGPCHGETLARGHVGNGQEGEHIYNSSPTEVPHTSLSFFGPNFGIKCKSHKLHATLHQMYHSPHFQFPTHRYHHVGNALIISRCLLPLGMRVYYQCFTGDMLVHGRMVRSWRQRCTSVLPNQMRFVLLGLCKICTKQYNAFVVCYESMISQAYHHHLIALYIRI